MSKLAQERHYGLDLLRILSMYMIVVLHLIGQGGVRSAVARDSVNYYLVRLLNFATLGATSCYAMLSGYFGAGLRKRFASIASVWLQVFVYSFGITLVFRVFTDSDLSLTESLFPVVTKQYWYFTAYFVVFLLAPVLNAAVEKLSTGQLATVLLTLGLVFCSSDFFGDVFILNGGYSPHWLAYLYLVGGLVRRVGTSGRPWKWAAAYGGFVILNVIVQRLCLKLRWENMGILLHYNSPLVLPMSVCLFLFFANCNIKAGTWIAKVIGFLTPLTFGVYLIHTHLAIFALMEKKFTFLGGSPILLIPGLLGVALAIFAGCALVDWLRKLLFGLLHIRPLLEKLGTWLDKVMSRFLTKLIPTK